MADVKERHWHKVTTIVISSIAVGLTFISVVYYRQVDQRTQRVQLLDNKIKLFQDRLEAMTRVPKVRVSAKTLKDSGLPESAFSDLTSVPAVVEITHLGGETAHGLTVRVDSNVAILTVSPQRSVDTFTYSTAPDRHTITFEVPQLRRDELIRVVVVQKGLGELTLTSRIDQGEVIGVPRDRERVYPTRTESYRDELDRRDDIRWRSEALSYETALELSPDDFKNSLELEIMIRKLRDLRKNINEEPIFPINIDISSWAPLLYLILGLALSSFVAASIYDLADYRQRKKIADVHQQKSVLIGQSKEQIKVRLGAWDEATEVEDAELWDELLYYAPFSHASPLTKRWADDVPGAAIFLLDDVVVRIDFLRY